MHTLYKPYRMGDIELSNRIIMAPMTRSRAGKEDTADNMTALYYQQRATAGLIISEGTQISVEGQGYLFTPGIYNEKQIKGWSEVTAAVHERRGKIYAQLWHVGRISHTSLQNGNSPVSSVAVAAKETTCFAYNENGKPGQVPVSTPRALSTKEIPRIVIDYVTAAENAIAAGFDGVEIHGANGYLLEQFINAGLNTREDMYGGSTIESRTRFVLEVVDAVAGKIGAGRTGIRLAPFGRLFDMHAFDQEEETWLHLASELTVRKIAYVHISDQQTLGAQAIPDGFLEKFRNAYQGTLIVAGGYEKQSAEARVDAEQADLIAIGRPFISNPDLVERFMEDAPLTEPDRATFYGGGAEGYVDYPTRA